MKLSTTQNTIINAMARAFFVCAWAERQEERGKTYPGMELMDVAPKTPKYAREFALMFAGKLPSLHVVLEDAAWADVIEAHEKEHGKFSQPFYRHQHPELEDAVEAIKTMKYQRDLGHYLAMQGLGYGVSWFDGHADFAIEIPHVEASL